MNYELERTPLAHTEGLVVATTQWLRANEPALMLIEENRITSDLREDHRWQIIYVGRGDRVFEFPRSLGPAKNFKGIEGFIIFSGGEDSVEQLIDMAEVERSENKMKAILAENAANSTLIEAAVRREEQKRELVKRNERTLKAQFDIHHERKVF